MPEQPRTALELHRRIAALKDEARKNEEAWRRSQRRELELLEAADLGELLGRLTQGLRSSYSLRAATLLLSDPEHQMRHLLLSQRRRPDAFTGVEFVESAAALLPDAVARSRRPWLGPFAAKVHGALFAGRDDLRSVALLPLVRGQGIVGVLGLGSEEPGRFHRHLATDFLRHLAVIAAFALENVVNRERLVLSGFTDVLTGWHNRRYLESRLREEIARSRREQSALSCLLIDVDHFKRINDTHGHLAGDDTLRLVAARIDGQVRASDVSARYGGEEFVVLLPGTGLAAATALAERVRAAVAEQAFAVPGCVPLPVTVSIGVSEHGRGASKGSLEHAAEALLGAADAALYAAKNAGRNAVVAASAPRARRRALERPA